MRDSQQQALQDMTSWACTDENRALQELFVYLSDLNSLWSEVQTQFIAQINEFKHQFEMILEGAKAIDAARNKFAQCENNEHKARKELKKVQKRRTTEQVQAVEAKVIECERQRELAQNEVCEKIRENEVVKLIRVKEGLLKLSEAYLTLAHKCTYVFEAQRDIARGLPDVEDKEIHEIRFDGISGAKEALERAKSLVKEYRGSSRQPISPSSSRHSTTDPPPPYSPGPYYSNTPFNPYYCNANAINQPNTSQSRNEASGNVYPNLRTEEELAGAMDAAKI